MVVLLLLQQLKPQEKNGKKKNGKSGSDGFDINSLNPEDPDYREDLHHKITRVGSYF